MTDCRRIEALLTPYVDGEARPHEIATVNNHLAICSGCRAQVAAERTARAVVRARASELTAAAPPGLRTRIAALLNEPAVPTLGWRGRLTAFGAAAAAILLVVTALEFVTPRSTVLLAAQLAIDHVRCFVVARHSTDEADADALRHQLSHDYGWTVDVPPSNTDAGLKLVSARRCPFWLGPYAHLMYRAGDRKVSLYVTPGQDRAAEQLQVLGHVERLWTAKGSSYALIARGVDRADLQRIADYLERQTQD